MITIRRNESKSQQIYKNIHTHLREQNIIFNNSKNIIWKRWYLTKENMGPNEWWKENCYLNRNHKNKMLWQKWSMILNSNEYAIIFFFLY